MTRISNPGAPAAAVSSSPLEMRLRDADDRLRDAQKRWTSLNLFTERVAQAEAQKKDLIRRSLTLLAETHATLRSGQTY